MPNTERLSDSRETVPQLTLTVIAGPDAGTSVELTMEEVFIGRHPACGLRLTCAAINSRHARLLRNAAGYQLIDNGSRNGTHLNGRRIEAAVQLNPGDIIVIVDSVLQFASR